MKILITGGLGYIGSHIAARLKDKAIIIDNLSNSRITNFNQILPECKIYKKDLTRKNLNIIFKENKINKVIHLAGFKSVDESIINPIKYYENNLITTIELLKAMNENNINKLVFSSSATVYDNKSKIPFIENSPTKSNSPYGSTKIINENILEEYSSYNKKFKYISLRYFNPVGTNRKNPMPENPLGKPKNIMPMLIYKIRNNKTFKIYGNDYPTRDGTCIRDYIHIDDLTLAHIKALIFLNKTKKNEIINLGSGKGFSVLELIKTFEKINKVKIKYTFSKRRKGDIAECYADISKARKVLNWKPIYSLKDMCKDSFIA